MDDDVRFVTANGLRFGYLESGTGPLVLLVHGFPDTAHSWDATRPGLAAAGFRAVAVFTRGYAPTDVPPTEAYDSDTLGRDLLALVDALGGTPAVIVGHAGRALHAPRAPRRVQPRAPTRARAGANDLAPALFAYPGPIALGSALRE
ncbi:MAG: alpha/beta fold hydrolase [Deltaproteobacteria bacterium]|nr:alpha/beta fold hydrolase [Deltaproteobacteria bacterium]